MNIFKEVFRALAKPLQGDDIGEQKKSEQVVRAEDNQAVRYEDSTPVEYDIVIGSPIGDGAWLKEKILELAESQKGTQHYSRLITVNLPDRSHIDIRVYHPHFLRRDKQGVIQLVRSPKVHQGEK